MKASFADSALVLLPVRLGTFFPVSRSYTELNACVTSLSLHPSSLSTFAIESSEAPFARADSIKATRLFELLSTHLLYHLFNNPSTAVAPDREFKSKRGGRDFFQNSTGYE